MMRVMRHSEETLKPQTGQNKMIQGWLRPLSMPSIRTLPFKSLAEKIDPIMLLRDLCRDSPTDPLRPSRASRKDTLNSLLRIWIYRLSLQKN